MKNQRGTVLLVALVFIVVLSVLAIAGFQENFLQNKIVAGRILNEHYKNSVDIALRDGEMRLYSAINYREIIDEDVTQLTKNCSAEFNNVKVEFNIPCLVKKIEDINVLNKFYKDPVSKTDAPWQVSIMKSGKNLVSTGVIGAKFNSYLISSSLTNSVEWDEQMEGRGTYYYLVNGVSLTANIGKNYVVQSIFANYYPGLNN